MSKSNWRKITVENVDFLWRYAQGLVVKGHGRIPLPEGDGIFGEIPVTPFLVANLIRVHILKVQPVERKENTALPKEIPAPVKPEIVFTVVRRSLEKGFRVVDCVIEAYINPQSAIDAATYYNQREREMGGLGHHYHSTMSLYK